MTNLGEDRRVALRAAPTVAQDRQEIEL